MSELSIKVTIANRVYPLTIKREEEESVRKATKFINDRIKEYEDNYSVRDKQDLLAMCALQFATQAVNSEVQPNEVEPNVAERVVELEKFVSDYLKRD